MPSFLVRCDANGAIAQTFKAVADNKVQAQEIALSHWIEELNPVARVECTITEEDSEFDWYEEIR